MYTCREEQITSRGRRPSSWRDVFSPVIEMATANEILVPEIYAFVDYSFSFALEREPGCITPDLMEYPVRLFGNRKVLCRGFLTGPLFRNCDARYFRKTLDENEITELETRGVVFSAYMIEPPANIHAVEHNRDSEDQNVAIEQ